LNIHRNTLEYRMRRIEAVAGIRLDDPNSRLAIELGIRLLEMKRLTHPEQASQSPPEARRTRGA
jgi:DNA-binding PucR family transcriptional regulator